MNEHPIYLYFLLQSLINITSALLFFFLPKLINSLLCNCFSLALFARINFHRISNIWQFCGYLSLLIALAIWVGAATYRFGYCGYLSLWQFWLSRLRYDYLLHFDCGLHFCLDLFYRRCLGHQYF